LDEAKADPNLNVEVIRTLDIIHMDLTCSPELSEPLSDQRVRKAILLALDREGMIESALHGYGLLPPSVLPIGLEGVDPDMTEERDLDRARALLKEAGYEDGATITLAYPIDPMYETIAAKIKSDLSEVGITVELDPMEHSMVWAKSWEEQSLPLLITYWFPDYIDYTIWTDYWGYSDHDWGSHMHCQVPPELEEASYTIAHETDPEKRLQAVRDWQEIMMDFAYGTAIFQPNLIVVMNKDVKGFGYLPVVYTEWGALYK
jgi:ABC-type transport system substrate-binding protein